MNYRVRDIQAGGSAGRGDFIVYAHPARFAAEKLIRYLGYFSADSRLLKHMPIGLCPNCAALFLKRRSNQACCSPKCRFESWRTEVGSDYWKAEKRRARKQKRSV
jgi:hypothetical protein